MSHWWTDKNFGNSRIEQVTLAELHRILDAAPAKRPRNEIILHHTWSPTAAQYKGRPTWAAIDGYHEKTRGWSDIGYHIGVAPDGSIWLLRPIQASGAHCVGHNSYGIGVVMLGNYDKGKDDPAKVLPMAADVCAALCKRFDIPVAKIFGHRDFANKSCPGTAIDMGAFRKSVAGGSAPKPAPATTNAWRFKCWVQDGEVKGEGIATTWWDHTTRTGVPADTPGLIACSLPRALCKETMGSPFAGVPDFAVVKVWYAKTGKVIYAPVIDEGPGFQATAGTGKPGSAMIDLTRAAKQALGFRDVMDNAEVTIRILRDSAAAGRKLCK